MARRFMAAFSVFVLLAATVAAQTTTTRRDRLDLADLKTIERHLVDMAAKVIPATVGIRIEGVQGSGVIVSEDGVILTAAHLFERAGVKGRILFHDGRVAAATTLGRHDQGDFALMRIDAKEVVSKIDTESVAKEGQESTKVKWPFVEIRDSDDFEVGDLCLAVGHPGGFQRNRTPPFRFGRVTSLGGSRRSRFMRTSCPINHGDSGGPLFDIRGRVVGIHSRIQAGVRQNFHVPIGEYLDNWDRLLRGENWGAQFRRGPVLGVRGADAEGKVAGCRVDVAYSDRPAGRAGVKAEDIITKVDGEAVSRFEDLIEIIRDHEVGDTVTLEIVRDGKTIELEMKLDQGGRSRNRRRQE